MDNIHLYEDKWIEASHFLREVIQGPLNKHDLYLTVSPILSNGVWNFSGISFNIPNHIEENISNTYTQTSIPKNKDTFYWNLTLGGKFNSSCAFNLLPYDQ